MQAPIKERYKSDPGAAIVGNGYEQATDFLPTDWLTALQGGRSTE